jgi:hypothetical protein
VLLVALCFNRTRFYLSFVWELQQNLSRLTLQKISIVDFSKKKKRKEKERKYKGILGKMHLYL